MSDKYYHIPTAECGKNHWLKAKKLGDVTCITCIELIQKGFDHQLPPGKSDFRSRAERIRDAENRARMRALKIKPPVIIDNKPKCSCGFNQVQRYNSYYKSYFMGCENYPLCKITSKIPKDEKI